jgi:hypothetical protein
VGEQLAGLRIGQPRLRGGLGAPAVKDLTLREDAFGLAGDRADQLHLERERRVSGPCLERGVDRAAHRAVEERRRVAAVDDADRVVVLLVRRALEDRASRLELDRLHPQEDGDRRRRQLAGDDRLDVLEPRHPGAGGRDRHRVLPGDEALAGGLRRALGVRERGLRCGHRRPPLSPASVCGRAG